MRSAKIIQFPKAQIIQFPKAEKPQPQATPQTAQELGEEAMALTAEAHSDLCTLRSNLRLIVKDAPQDRKAINAYILAIRETFIDGEINLTKLLQQIDAAQPAGAL